MTAEPVRAKFGGLRASRAENDAIAQVAVVIVNYNSGPHLAHCLAALEAQTFRDYTVVIVDNASRDESLRGLDSLPEGWQVLRLEENIGFAAGNNRAIAMVRSPWVA